MLAIPMWINNREAGRAELVRIQPINGQPQDNEMCTYTLRYYAGHRDPVVNTTIKFPYKTGDPLPLTIAALSKIEVMKPHE